MPVENLLLNLIGLTTIYVCGHWSQTVATGTCANFAKLPLLTSDCDLGKLH